MKIRSSFVANSSSSSFIIGIKDFSKLKGYEGLPIWCKKFIEKQLKFIEKEKSYSTKEELDAYILYNYAYGESLEEFLADDERFANNYYYPMLRAIENGYKVKEVSVDNNDETGSEFYECLPREDDGSGLFLIHHSC